MLYSNKLIGILILGSVSLLGYSSQVLIFTHAYNRPDFIEIQYKSFKKFLKDDYTFVVFNDATNPAIEQQIYKTCEQCGIECIRIPQDIHNRAYLYRRPGEPMQNANIRCANVVQYSLNTLGFDHNGIVAIFDSDLFLIREFSIVKFMESYDIAGVAQDRDNNVRYFWNGLVFMDMQRLPNKRTIDFNCGIVNGSPCDVGGYTHHYLSNNPTVRVHFFNVDFIHNFNFVSAQQTKEVPIQEGNIFFHYYAGTNWVGYNPHYLAEKTALFNAFFDRLLS